MHYRVLEFIQKFSLGSSIIKIRKRLKIKIYYFKILFNFQMMLCQEIFLCSLK